MASTLSTKYALRAWAKASTICLVASPVIFFVWELWESSTSQEISFTSAQVGLFFVISGIAAVVHFLAFLLIGLPLFLYFYSRPVALLWRRFSGIITGTTIGALSAPLLLSDLYNRQLTEGLIETAFLGALYGGFTSIACILNRPNVEQYAVGNPFAAE